MMKSILSATLSIAAFAALAGSTYIPRANDRTLAVSPLVPGETAYVPKQDGAALYVGGLAGNLLVTDPTALRSYSYAEIPRTEYAVSGSAGVEYVASNDTWRVTTTSVSTATVLIAFPIGLEPSHVEMDKVVQHEGRDPNTPGEIIVNPISNGVIRVDLRRTKVGSADIHIGNIHAYHLVGGAEGRINDALSNVWLVKDSLGTFDLGNLRHEMTHKFDGNRGEDWSAYAAREDVRLDGYGIRFDPKSRYQAYVDTETNLVIQAGGIDAINVRFEGANIDPTVFKITEFTHSTNSASFLAWSVDIDGASADDFDVIWADRMDSTEWTPFTDAECEIAYNDETDEWNAWIPGRDASREFYRINYHGVVSEVLQVTIRGEVTIPDALLLGTGTNAVNVAAALSSKLTGIEANGELAPVTNGVAYVRVSGGTDADEVRGLIDGSFGGGTNAVNELTAHVHSDTNNHPIATVGGVAAAVSSSVVALGGTTNMPPVELDWWQAIVDATPEMRIGTYVIPNGTAFGHRSSDTLAIYDGHVTDYSWKGGDFARYSLDVNGASSTLTYLGGSTGFSNSIGGCYSWDGMTAYVHDYYGCGQYAVNEPFGAVLSDRKSVSAFFGYAGAISRDGHHFLGQSGSNIMFYDLSVSNDLTTGIHVGTLNAKTLPGMSDFTCHSFAVSPDGKKLILVNQTANLALISLSAAWNSANATLVGVKTFGTHNWTSVAFDDRGLLMLGTTDATSASIHVIYTDPQPVESRYQTKTNGVAVTAKLADLPLAERVVVGIDGEAVTNLVTDIVTNTVHVPTAEEWAAIKERLAEIEARLNAAGGE